MKITKFFPVSREKYEYVEDKHKEVLKMINLYKHERDRAEGRVDELLAEREESEKVMFSVSVSLGEAHKTIKNLKYVHHHESMQES